MKKSYGKWMALLGILLLAGCNNASTGYGNFNYCNRLGWCNDEKKKPPSFACEVLGQCGEGEGDSEGAAAGGGAVTPGVGVDGSTPGGTPGHDAGHDAGHDPGVVE